MKRKELQMKLIEILQDKKPKRKIELTYYTDTSEREVRRAIAEINADEISYPDILIVATSDKAGYRMIDPMSEDDQKAIEHFVNEREKRARETLAPLAKARRLANTGLGTRPLWTDHEGNLHLF